MDFDLDYLTRQLPALRAGLVLTVQASALAILISIAIGLLGASFRVLRLPVLAHIVVGYVEFIRNTPILVQIFLFYYGLPALGLDLTPIQAGVLAIALNSSIFITEIMRGGLAGMDPGPVEAAIALGVRARTIWTRVILPQLYIRILPPLVNELTTIVKGTALLSVITVVEVLRTAQQIANTTFRPLEALLAAAIPALAATAAVFWVASPGQFASPLFHLASGGAMLAAFFIVTDPVSGATTPRGKLIFAAGVGVLAYLIRNFGAYPEGIAFAVLLMNMCVPLIDMKTQPRVFGHRGDKP